MKFIFESVWFCWLLSEILLNRLYRSNKDNSQSADKNSLRLIWITLIIAGTTGTIISFYTRFPIVQSVGMNYAGLVIIVIGMIIRFTAIRTLGKFFTVDVARHNEHELINVGLYKYIRHPSYTGSLISFLGFGLSLNNWISLAVVFIPVFISFINRINIEEEMLLEQLGAKYAEYCKATKRLLPFLY